MDQAPSEFFKLQTLERVDREKIESLIEERANAKRERDFVKADLIRKKMEASGILLKDKSDKTEWSLSSNFNQNKVKEL